MVSTEMDVNDIRFTQEHIYDAFNANDERASGLAEFIESILSGHKTPLDMPLIRVAVKKGAYWCVDNRRLFVYKHCQLGRIPVQVCGWKDNREFELKWRNGRSTRSLTGNGARVGVIQRTEAPFPKSPVAEPSLSSIAVPYSQQQQRKHDAAIEKLRRRREGDAVEGAAAERAVALAASQRQLGSLLLGSQGGHKRKAKAAREDSTATPLASVEEGGQLRPARRVKRRKRSSAGPAVTEAVDGAKMTVAMDGDGSSDEAYAVELVALG